MDKKMHVVIMTNIPSPYRVDFFKFLQRSYTNYFFSIIFQAGNDASFREWDDEIGGLENVFFLESAGISDKNTKADLKEIFITKGVGSLLSKLSPNVCVIAEYNQTALFMRDYCVRHKIPYISWTDGTRYSERNLHFYHRIARKYIISKAAAFIASSSDSADNQVFLGAAKDKVHISELAIDIHKFDNCEVGYNPDGYLLAVGSLVERKGIDLLLKALSECKDLDWKLHLVGSGDAEDDLRNLAEKSGISDRVEFKGYLKGQALIDEYKESSLYVFPTREDCFGLVTLEAMCCGIPVIASKYAASSRDLVTEDVTGYIIDPFDEQSFSKTIRKAFSDKKKLIKMSLASKKKSEKYDFSYTSNGFIEAIDEVLKN